MAYYDTTGSRKYSYEQYKEYAQINVKQETAILNVARILINNEFSPSQMLQKMESMGKLIPITSVRRAISDLTRDGKLVKTDKQVIGIYGRKEYVWRLA